MDSIKDLFNKDLKDVLFLELDGQYLNKCKALTENYAKVNFVEDLLIKFNCIEVMLQNSKLREEKCNVKSLELRKMGNAQFSKKKNLDYCRALELWNESICYSEPGSENLSIGYANRSAVLFEWKRYRECLANIDLARKANYPVRLMYKLNKREADCRNLLATQLPDRKLIQFKLTYKQHPLVPHIADCLELKQTKEEGRFITTKRNLRVGDIVATEKPFCSVLKPTMRYKRCVTCQAENYLTLIPCESCCSAMFCSEDCREKALATFHKYECPIIDFLLEIFKYSIPLRVCLTALDAFGSIEELMEFCGDPKNQNKSAFDLDYMNFTQREYYRSIHGLQTHQHLRDDMNLFLIANCCAVLKHVLLNNTPLKEVLGGEEGENFFADLLFRHFQTTFTNTNCTRVIDYQIDNTLSLSSLSLCTLGLSSILNHSCAPNVSLFFKGNKAYLYVLRPVTAGGELHVCYRDDFLHCTKNERQRNLSTNFFFTCKCEACKNNYPTMEMLSVNPYLNFLIEGYGFYTYDFALANYRKICNFLKENVDAYPCQQLADAEFSLRCAFYILTDAVTLKAKYKIHEAYNTDPSVS